MLHSIKVPTLNTFLLEAQARVKKFTCVFLLDFIILSVTELYIGLISLTKDFERGSKFQNLKFAALSED